MRRVFLVVVAASSVACSLIVGLDDLRSDGGSDASANDAPSASDSIVIIDAGSDGFFFDDFNRADDASIGNGWIEKDPRAWTLADAEVLRLYVDNAGYVDDIVYRPASEDLADVALTAEFVFFSANIGYAQLHARVQQSTVQVPDVEDAYLMAIHDWATVNIDVQHGGQNPVTVGSFTLAPQIVIGDRYRFNFSVAHVPPTITGSIEHKNSDGTWTTLGSTQFLDTSDAAIITPGSVGFSGSFEDIDANYAFDNFTRTAL